MSEKVEIFHFDDIANSYHGESLYCGLSSSLSLQVDKDCTITVFGQINPRSGEYFQLQVLNEETMKTSPNITSAGNYFVHIAGCYHIKFQVENATDVNVGGVFGNYHYPSAEVDLDDYASIEYVDSKLGAATDEEFKEMLTEVFGSFQDNGTDIPTQDITNLLSKYMEKSTYDTNNNGIVDTVESLSENSVINGGNA
jgi:hypothetical protein